MARQCVEVAIQSREKQGLGRSRWLTFTLIQPI
jgi:hypothetical protein